MNYLNWLKGNIYYSLVRLFVKPYRVYEANNWRYEEYSIDYLFFGQILYHKEKILSN